MINNSILTGIIIVIIAAAIHLTANARPFGLSAKANIPEYKLQEALKEEKLLEASAFSIVHIRGCFKCLEIRKYFLQRRSYA
jgi:hypothetical protein